MRKLAAEDAWTAGEKVSERTMDPERATHLQPLEDASHGTTYTLLRKSSNVGDNKDRQNLKEHGAEETSVRPKKKIMNSSLAGWWHICQ